MALVTTAASKTAAQQACKDINPAAELMMPKTDQTARQLQQFISSKTVQDGNFYLGMSKIGGQWIWDDGSPVFVQCENTIDII